MSTAINTAYLPATRGRRHGLLALTERQVCLLAALVTEPSMASAAEALGISDRHARRIAAETRAALGVATNRQAIAAAVAQGAIDVKSLAQPSDRRQGEP